MEKSNKKNIVISDETILSFYRENPNIDIITMNHIFIDILKKLSTNLTETLSNSIHAKILSTLSEISGSISSIKQDVSKINSDLLNGLSVKIHESKKEYLDALHLLFANYTLSNFDKIGSLLEKHNDSIIAKTTVLLNEIVPKSHTLYYSKIESSLQTLSNSLSNSTTKLLDHINREKETPEQFIKEYLSHIDSQFTKMVGSVQQPIFSFIQSSEQRTNDSIATLREKLASQHSTQESLSLGLHEFLNKYKYNSSLKGNVSESELYSVLQSIFPSDEIIDCRSEPASCDYRVNRMHRHKPTILFENKDYSRSATTEEVVKFERDIALQKCHGIFLSQNSHITYKENFHIDIIDGLIHVYVCNVRYTPEKIQIAVDLIDHLSQKLDYLRRSSSTESTPGFHIPQEDMDELLEEYNELNRRKSLLIESVRNSNKHILEKIDEMQFFSLRKVLVRNGALQSEEDFKCKFCQSFTGKSKASLGAHTRNCKSNPNKSSGGGGNTA